MEQKEKVHPKSLIKEIAKAGRKEEIKSSEVGRVAQWFKERKQERYDKVNYQGDHKWDYRV